MNRPRKLAAAVALGLLACRDSAGPWGGGTGAVALTILPSARGSATHLDSGYVRLTGRTDTTVKAVPGTNVRIVQLPPGAYDIALEGFAGGAVAYFGRTNGIVVTAGQTTQASVTFNPFVSTVTPISTPGRKTFTVSYSSVEGAESYEVEAASDTFFTGNRVTVLTTQTSTRVTAPTYETYYVRVRAIDPYLLRGQPSPRTSIVVTGVFYMIKEDVDSLQMLDPISLTITNVGPLGVSYSFGDCAWNPTDSTLYSITDMFALAYHPPTNALYAVSYANNSLYKFNSSTGGATLIGPTGATLIDGLIWDPVRNRFIALTGATQEFWSINVATGAGTQLTPSPGFISDLGLTYDPRTDRFWVAVYDGTIVQYNPVSYAGVTLATGRGQHTCIAHVP